MTEAMRSPYIRLSIRVTTTLHAQIELAMQNQFKSFNEFVITCIRAYLDETGDIVGSRRHFNNRMGERLDQLHATLLWNMLQTQMLIANNSYTIMDELAPEDAEAEPPPPDVQFSNAQQYSQRALARFLTDQDAIIEQLTEHLRKKRAHKEAKPPKKAKE